VLNNHLLHHMFLVGERITLADIVVSMSLLRLYTMVFEPEYRKDVANVERWFLTCVHQPHFLAVVGDVVLCDKAKEATVVAGEHHHHEHHHEHAKGEQKQPKEAKAKGEPKQPKQPKEAKAKGEPKPKKEEQPKPKKEEKPKEEPEEGSDGEEKDSKPKDKNPLDLLAPSPFQLDEWKRMYSNNDTKTVAMPWFWQHFDPAGYSLFKVDYRYNSELQKVFMTSNMINGWFQRLEKLHKYAFGSVVIHGQEPSLTVSGVWLFRGPDVPKDMTDCDDYALYTWAKLDAKDSAQHVMIDEYFAWEGEFGGKGKPEQGKVFK